MKIILTVAVLGSVGSVAGFAMAQGKQGEASGGDASSLLAKLEARCAHRRTMPPDPRDECASLPSLRAQLASGQGASATGAVSGSGAGQGIGPGIGAGQGNGIGPGNGQGNGVGPGNGGGKGGGRR
jgi:hypothetical protein